MTIYKTLDRKDRQETLEALETISENVEAAIAHFKAGEDKYGFSHYHEMKTAFETLGEILIV